MVQSDVLLMKTGRCVWETLADQGNVVFLKAKTLLGLLANNSNFP